MVRSSSGQATVEGILILALFVSLAIGLSKQFKETEIISNIVSGPWRSLDGMIQDGAWLPTSKSHARHPMNHRSSLDSDDLGE